MRTDPTDNGGLFIGRRPGTAPVRYATLPEPGSERRRRIDARIAAAILALMTVINLTFWGPLPMLGLWIGSQVQYVTGSVSVGISVSFAFLLAALLGGLVVLKRLDQSWILVRRAAGHDQRSGVLGRLFVITCGIGSVAFIAWLLLFSGAQLAPLGMQI